MWPGPIVPNPPPTRLSANKSRVSHIINPPYEPVHPAVITAIGRPYTILRRVVRLKPKVSKSIERVLYNNNIIMRSTFFYCYFFMDYILILEYTRFASSLNDNKICREEILENFSIKIQIHIGF